MQIKMRIKHILSVALMAFLPLLVQAQDDIPNASESKLTFPNAFSPNGDGINDIYKAKEQQGLAEFHAYIFNRRGQKLYEWTDPAEGWDGTYNGKNVKEGVYFVLAKAKGVDGKTYNIRKDVNLLRGFINSEK
jgi:gliding motility-associated-like protein